MRKLTLAFFCCLLFPALAPAQFLAGIAPVTGTINASGATCTALVMDSTNSGPSNCVSMPLPSQASTASIVLAGTFGATVQFELTADSGRTWVAAPVASSSIAGTTTFGIGGYSGIRARASAYSSGFASVTITIGTGAANNGIIPSAVFPLSAGYQVTLQYSGNAGGGPGLYLCANTNGCTTPADWSKLPEAIVAATTVMPSNASSAIGESLANKGMLGYGNVNNVTNLGAHQEYATPTVGTIAAAPSDVAQPFATAIIFPGTIGPQDVAEVEFSGQCTTCASDSKKIQIRLGGSGSQANTCTLTSNATTAGAANALFRLRVDVFVQADLNHQFIIVYPLQFAGVNSFPTTPTACTDTLGDGFVHTIDLSYVTPSGSALPINQDIFKGLLVNEKVNP